MTTPVNPNGRLWKTLGAVVVIFSAGIAVVGWMDARYASKESVENDLEDIKRDLSEVKADVKAILRTVR